MMKKKCGRHATFSLLVAILIWVAMLGGCAPSPPIPEDRFKRAQELVELGTASLKGRDLRGARMAFELASELAPVAAAVDGQGCVALLEGRYAEAEGFFGKAYQMDRKYDEALVNLGLTRELQGRFEEARAIYNEYLENNPDSVKARNNLAALEYDHGRRTIVASEAFEKARALSDQAVIRDNLAVLRGGGGAEYDQEGN